MMHVVTDGVGWLNPLSMLGAADLDYVAARSMLLSALFPGGQAKAAEAIEKLLKLFALCEAGVRTGKLLTPNEVRKFGHDLISLFNFAVQQLRIAGIKPLGLDGGAEILAFLTHLQSAYEHRYPDQWALQMAYSSDDLHHLDGVYTWLRNAILPNMPPGQLEKARIFAGSFAGAYTPEVLTMIHSWGALSPFDLLRLNNDKLADLQIRHDLLPE